MKEQIDEKRSTVYTSSRYSLCLLKNPHTKCNKTFGNNRVGIYKIRFVLSYDRLFVSTLVIHFYEVSSGYKQDCEVNCQYLIPCQQSLQ